MAEYPGADWAGVSPRRSVRQGDVQLFIVHHWGSTREAVGQRDEFMRKGGDVSPNYQVNADGSVWEIVPPDNYRAWTTGQIDHQAVTCETQNTSREPNWGISAESHEAIAQLVAWAADRYNFPIQRGEVADGNIVTRPGVVGHNETPAGQSTSTLCPGPSMDLNWIVARAQQIANPAVPTQEEDEDMSRPICVALRGGNGVTTVKLFDLPTGVEHGFTAPDDAKGDAYIKNVALTYGVQADVPVSYITQSHFNQIGRENEATRTRLDARAGLAPVSK